MLIERVRPLFHLDRRPLHERIEAVVAELAHAVGGACALARLSGEPPDLDVVAAAHADPQAGDELQAILARAPGRRAHRLLGGVLRGEALLRRSVVAVPVVVGGAPCGALVLARAAEREGFGETDLHEAQEVADRLGLVWAGGHAEDEPAERQAVVAALGRRALAGAPPLAVTREALTTVVERLGLQRGAGVRVTDDGGMERVIAVPPPGDADEARADERLGREALAGAGATVVGTALVVPVFGERERVLGAAVLHAGRPDAFDDAARHFAQSLANVVGTATERRRASVRAAHLRSHDALTGLTNRAGLADRGRRALRRSAREGRAAAVLLLEVDGLRALRQRRGRAAADEVLRALAARMEGGLDGALVARVGGDEFAILAPGAHAEGAALALAERVGALVAEPVTAAGEEVAVTVSTGIVVAEPGDVDVERLLAAAEEGRARATRLGGGRYELVTRAMRGRAVQRLELEHDLRRALRTGDELDVHFHPVVRLADGALAAFEALLRWHHPRRGLLAAADFLAVAESAGLSAELGDHVLEHAYHSLARWSAALPPGEVPSVQVNVSPQQIARPGFAGRLVAALERIGAAPGLMELELTETALIEDHPGALDTLQRLSALGVQLALDDFGTGTAALARLRRVPFDTLKIDRSFIADLAGGGRDAALVEAMIRMGRTLALTVVAEGIETPEQLRLARELGCDRAQGFLFERPLSADAALALARDHRRWDVAGSPSRAPERGGAEADERLLTLSQAAGVLGVSTTTLRRWANAGEVASVRTVGGHRRFRAGDVRGVRARRRTPTLRAGAPPDRALPPLARVVERTGMRVMRAAWADLYDDAPGFFADPRAQEAHARWLQAVAGAAATGRYTSLGEATESLMAQARRHGAPLLERHRALERAGDALAGQVAHAGAQRREVAETRRLFVFLRERHLAAAE